MNGFFLMNREKNYYLFLIGQPFLLIFLGPLYLTLYLGQVRKLYNKILIWKEDPYCKTKPIVDMIETIEHFAQLQPILSIMFGAEHACDLKADSDSLTATDQLGLLKSLIILVAEYEMWQLLPSMNQDITIQLIDRPWASLAISWASLIIAISDFRERFLHHRESNSSKSCQGIIKSRIQSAKCPYPSSLLLLLNNQGQISR